MGKNIFDVIVIGGGLSGSYLSYKLKNQGLNTLIIEKSKTIGGRLCTKPVGESFADYGCQYLDPKTDELKKLISVLEKKSLVKKININEKKSVYISPYGMNKIPQFLALGVPTLLNTLVDHISYENSLWDVQTNLFSYKCKSLVLTMPIQQVKLLIPDSLIIKHDLPKCEYKHFLTAMFSHEPRNSKKMIDFNPEIPWICNNKIKGLLNRYDVSTANFTSEKSLELQKSKYNHRIKKIKDMLEDHGYRQINNLSAHYWKYAYSEKQKNLSHIFDGEKKLGICGDSFSLGKVDGAVFSAQLVYEDLKSVVNY